MTASNVMHKSLAPLAAIGLALALGSPPAVAGTTISSSAYGLGATETVLGFLTVTVGPVAPSGGTAPGPYSSSNSVLSFTDSVMGLPLLSQGLNTGVITTSASSPFPPTATGTATATVNNLSTALDVVLGPALLGLDATTITSTSSVSGVGPLSAVGSTTIEDLTATGAALGGANIDISGTFVPPPNDVIFNLGGLEIILNQQITSGDGTTSDGIQTNALVIDFTNFAFGTGILNGDIIVAESQANINVPVSAPTPEPATWALMLTGVGLIGGALRRRARPGLA